MDRVAAIADWFVVHETATVCVISAAALAALGHRKRAIRGTTLVAPWYWSAVSIAVIAATEMLVGWLGGTSESKWIAPVRFAAATGAYTPLVALLGAKRPQDRPWQFIVLSLWAILSLPAVKWLLFGGVAELHPAWLSFLAILTLLGVLNGLGTRFWLSSVLMGMGQVALLGPHWPWTWSAIAGDAGPLVGLTAIAGAIIWPALGWPRSRGESSGINRAWLDFRDAFGGVWALRIRERMNTSARMYDWPVTLSWHGFVDRPGGAQVEHVPEAVLESFRTLLRRFVSPEWINDRLGGESQAR